MFPPPRWRESITTPATLFVPALPSLLQPAGNHRPECGCHFFTEQPVQQIKGLSDLPTVWRLSWNSDIDSVGPEHEPESRKQQQTSGGLNFNSIKSGQ